MTPIKKHFRKRDAILACLQQTRVHPGAEWIYQQLKPELPDLSLGTVYRNLTLFKEQGLVRSLGTVGGVERFDGRTHPHVHFICSSCQCVLDLEELPLPQSLLESARRYGRVEDCQLTFTGICQACIRRAEDAG